MISVYCLLLYAVFTASCLAFTSPLLPSTNPSPLHLIRSPLLRRSSSPLSMVNKDLRNELMDTAGKEEPPFNRRLVYGSLWAALTAYVFLLSPSSSSDLDNSLIQACIGSPFKGEISAIFASIFNTFPIVNIIYASLLLPATKKQSLPAPIFLIGQFAFGFFVLAPYLALRNLVADVSDEEKGKGTVLFESKISILLPTAFFLFLLYNAVFGASVSQDRISDYVELVKQSRFVQASALDLSVLTFAVRITLDHSSFHLDTLVWIHT